MAVPRRDEVLGSHMIKAKSLNRSMVWKGMWRCLLCGTENDDGRDRCYMCGHRRIYRKDEYSASSARVRRSRSKPHQVLDYLLTFLVFCAGFAVVTFAIIMAILD